MRYPSLFLTPLIFAGCASPVATLREQPADPHTIVLTAGYSAILSAGQTARVPYGTVVREPGGGSVMLRGHHNTVTATGGVIVSVPVNAPGPSDNTVIAAAVTLHDPDATTHPVADPAQPGRSL